MALNKCECGNMVSTDAKSCPKCGGKVNQWRKIVGFVVGGLIFFIIMELAK